MSPSSATRPVPSRRWTTAAIACSIFVVALASFRWELSSEPRFMDEAAFLSQSYFWDLAISGRTNSPLWLEYPAYDLPPLPKYLIGASLQLHGIARTGRSWAIAWYRDPGEARFVTAESLQAARMPSLLLGALGCVAIFALGTLAVDRRVGLVAAGLLLVNPLYRLLSRRAMADVPAEALILCTLALALVIWKGCLNGRTTTARAIILSIAVGVLSGLAVLAKLNGGLALMTVAAWAGLGVLWSLFRPSAVGSPLTEFQLSGGTFVAGLCALSSFIVLNPFITAGPTMSAGSPLMAPAPPNQSMTERLSHVVRHRVDVSRHGQTSFPRDALRTTREKGKALLVQGFGRFGPFGPSHADSTRRYDWTQDRGALIWFPCVLAGLLWALVRGIRQTRAGEAPTSWALALQFLVSLLTVGMFLPLAWDRYFLPIQSSSALLVAGASVSTFDRIRKRAGYG
ncbi:MAG: family glycosyltransferase, 4-amino-4-deoxy-L-arabinose transferase [Planctomycetota bacterium]|nr:family glycosyltransferase, 4-amino-4-deoxy-L-arabinose transferase [Planctomycetota bacterium]